MKLFDYANSQRGIQRNLASLLAISPVTVSLWVNSKRQVPAEYCPKIEKATDGHVTCEELRPDVNWAVLRRASK